MTGAGTVSTEDVCSQAMGSGWRPWRTHARGDYHMDHVHIRKPGEATREGMWMEKGAKA